MNNKEQTNMNTNLCRSSNINMIITTRWCCQILHFCWGRSLALFDIWWMSVNNSLFMFVCLCLFVYVCLCLCLCLCLFTFMFVCLCCLFICLFIFVNVRFMFVWIEKEIRKNKLTAAVEVLWPDELLLPLESRIAGFFP